MRKIRTCPVCGRESDNAKLFLKKNINSTKITDFTFASRKTPEFMSHELVRCLGCDLIYATEPPSEGELIIAYQEAAYDSSQEADDAAEAYIQAIGPIINALTYRNKVLEIGAGTGIFLEHLSRDIFVEVIGIEPSSAAIAAAPLYRQAWIRKGMFEETIFEPESFDMICCFMTMEHVSNPLMVARSAFNLLKPGGVFVTVTHDYRSSVNRLFGKHSPIIDIEHLQLFSQRSIKNLFQTAGYKRITVIKFVNAYSIKYWLRLTPLPSFVKHFLSIIFNCSLGRKKIKINVGNIMAAGFK